MQHAGWCLADFFFPEWLYAHHCTIHAIKLEELTVMPFVLLFCHDAELSNAICNVFFACMHPLPIMLQLIKMAV